MQYLVLKELPQGQQPGAIVELPEPQGDVLELVGAVRPIDARETAETSETLESSSPRRRYRRRDLEAETT